MITEDNKLVIPGNKIYELAHTYGYPLSLALDMINKFNFVLDWEGYFVTALKDNMIMENEYRRASEAVMEAFDVEYFKEWDKRAKVLLLKILKEDKND